MVQTRGRFGNTQIRQQAFYDAKGRRKQAFFLAYGGIRGKFGAMNKRTYKHLLRAAAVATAALALVSCETTTPATRIQENPAMFSQLPEKQQQLVRAGRIAHGMSPSAVYLAWGAPQRKVTVGMSNGKTAEKWVYTTPRPVTVTNDFYPYRPWRGPYWDAYPYSHMSTAWVQEESGGVLFEGGKVVSWQQQQ